MFQTYFLIPGKLYLAKQVVVLFKHDPMKTFDMGYLRSTVQLIPDIDVVTYVKYITNGFRTSSIFLVKNDLFQITYENILVKSNAQAYFKEIV